MNVLISIKPEFVEEIVNGGKRYEYRKVVFKKKVDRVFVYASSPLKRVIGYFVLGKVIKDEPERVWDITKMGAGIQKAFFDEYFKDSEFAYALQIRKMVVFENAIDPFVMIKSFKAPQSFCYINNDQLASLVKKYHLLVNRK